MFIFKDKIHLFILMYIQVERLTAPAENSELP